MESNIEELSTKIEQQRLFLRGVEAILKILDVQLYIDSIRKNQIILGYAEQIFWDQKRDIKIEVRISLSNFPDEYNIDVEKYVPVKKESTRHERYSTEEHTSKRTFMSTSIPIPFMDDTSGFTDQITINEQFVQELRAMYE